MSVTKINASQIEGLTDATEVVADHEAAPDPHTGYKKESDFVGFTKITVSATPPADPGIGDLWIQIPS